MVDWIETMRRGLLLSSMAAAWLGAAAVGEAAYVIRLKNGNEYITGRYWQEGNQVLFDTFDGTFGIEKSFIARIVKTDPLKLRVVMDRELGDTAPAPPAKSEKNPSEAKSKEESKTEKSRDPEDPIVGEFNRMKEKSKDVQGLLTSEIRDLLNQITTFRNKIAKDSKLFIEYGREFNDLHEIGTTVEEALRARTQ